MGLDSGIGISVGSPYTAAVDESTTRRTPAATNVPHQAMPCSTLFSKYFAGSATDSPTYVSAAKVDAGFNLVFRDNPRDELTVSNASPDRTAHLVHGAAMPANKIIEHNHVLALGPQPIDRHAPDISRPRPSPELSSRLPFDRSSSAALRRGPRYTSMIKRSDMAECRSVRECFAATSHPPRA